jgi:hypothetical protein
MMQLRRAIVLLAVVFSGCSNSRAKALVPFPCVEEWPKEPSTAPEPSLAATSAVVWIAGAGSEFLPMSRPGIALSKDNVVLSTADSVVAIDRRTGAFAWQYRNLASHQYYSPPVTDPVGNTYVTRDTAIDVIDPSGKGRTLLGFTGTSGPDSTEFGVFSQEVVMSPDGTLFHQSNDGTLRAVKSADGVELWSVKQAPWRPSAGVAKAIVVGPDLREVGTGRILGQFVGAGGLPVTVEFDQGSALSFSGFLGTHYADLSTVEVTLEVLSPCGDATWTSTTTGSYPMVDAIGPGGTAYVTGLVRDARNPERPNRVTAIGADGTRGSTIETLGRVMAIGADETIYVMDCSENSQHPTDVVGYSPDLVEESRLTVPGRCGQTNALLTDDGMLYFGRGASGGGAEIVGIQTKSPGLARSAWPTWRHDNRATAWLSPYP